MTILKELEMCLDSKFPDRKKKAFIKQLEERVDDYVWLWKSFMVNDDGTLNGSWRNFAYYDGINTAVPKELYCFASRGSYMSGFHCFASRKEAANYGCSVEIVVPVKVKKEWIENVGYSCNSTVVVCKHIII